MGAVLLEGRWVVHYMVTAVVEGILILDVRLAVGFSPQGHHLVLRTAGSVLLSFGRLIVTCVIPGLNHESLLTHGLHHELTMGQISLMALLPIFLAYLLLRMPIFPVIIIGSSTNQIAIGSKDVATSIKLLQLVTIRRSSEHHLLLTVLLLHPGF